MNIFQVGRDGEIKAAQDPFDWAACVRGSMWMPLGQKMIEGRLATEVVFMPIGVGATKVSDWQAGGAAFAKLNDAIEIIKRQNLQFDYVFWHQGSSDYGTSKEEYSTRLLSVIDYVNKSVKAKRWIIAVHSRCWNDYDPNVEAAQRAVGNAPEQGRFLGPDTNLLGNEFRFDQCHLNKNGQEKMASMWFESIRNANFKNN